MPRKVQFPDEMIAGALNSLPLGPHRITLAAKVLRCSHRTVLFFVQRNGIHLYYELPEAAAVPVIGNNIEIEIEIDDFEPMTDDEIDRAYDKLFAETCRQMGVEA